MLYSEFLNLKVNPFGESPSSLFFFGSQIHQSALDFLDRFIIQRRALACLVGETGTGKSTLIRTFTKKMGEAYPMALVFNPLLDSQQLLRHICEDFGLKFSKNRRNSIKTYLDTLNDFCIEQAKRNISPIIIIDEAQHLSFENLEMLRILTNFETEEAKLIQIVLIGQTELDDYLNQESLRQFRQRLFSRFLLKPINKDEVALYLHHRLAVAGATHHLRFQADCCRYLYRLSGGVPRVLNHLAGTLLLKANQSKTRLISLNHAKAWLADFPNPQQSTLGKFKTWMLAKRLRGLRK